MEAPEDVGPPRTAGLPELDEVARRVYARALESRGLRENDVAELYEEHAPAALKPTLDHLYRLGLLEVNEGRPDTYRAVDPRLVEARIGGEWRATAARLLDQAARLSRILSPFQEEFRELVERGRDNHELTYLAGKDVIRACVREAVEQSRAELLTAQPGGRRPAGVLTEARKRTTALLDRDISVRMLYQHTARYDPATRSFVDDMTELGAEVRTLDQLCERLIVIDRSTVFLSGDAQRETAVMTRSRPLIRFLVDVFEHNWRRAMVFDGTHGPKTSAVVSDRLRDTIVRCLIEGESDSAIAKRIGVSPRAYATHIAKLKAAYGAQTRFQLGYRLALAVAPDRLADAEPGAQEGPVSTPVL